MSPTALVTVVHRVRGMTCGHCAQAVRREIAALDGVRDVAVDLAAGTVTLTADRPMATEDVRAGVEEAGYELA